MHAYRGKGWDCTAGTFRERETLVFFNRGQKEVHPSNIRGSWLCLFGGRWWPGMRFGFSLLKQERARGEIKDTAKKTRHQQQPKRNGNHGKKTTHKATKNEKRGKIHLQQQKPSYKKNTQQLKFHTRRPDNTKKTKQNTRQTKATKLQHRKSRHKT